jgi:hypothetical protein
MQMFMSCIGALALMLILRGAATAATLYSPPLIPEAAGRLVCHVVNVSTKTLDITLEMYSFGGTLLGSFDCLGPVTAGGTCATNSTDNGVRYCKVIVSNKNTVRGSLMALSADNVTTAAVPIQ